MTHTITLRVCKADKDDVYGDVVRIHKSDRGNLHEGSFCMISCQQDSHVFRSIRGMGSSKASKNVIKMDMKTRKELDIKVGENIEFDIQEIGIWKQFCWAWNISDPTPRISARLGILSLGLGVLSLVLGGISICLAISGGK